jgi:hypothetical protein
MARFSQHQRPWWQLGGWYGGVGRSLLLLFTVSAAAHATFATPAQVHPSAATIEAPDAPGEEDPRVIFAQAQAWQAHGVSFPDAVRRKAVETALQPEATWDQITAAITAFDLYHDRPG